ncbi:MAG: low affinity iron permease family protein [Chitinophagales bacterium]
MKLSFDRIEAMFDRLVNFALKVYGNALTFIFAVIGVIFFLSNQVFYKQNLHDIIRDVIMCVTFLSFFIIQKAFNKYTAAVHLKMNELVSAHDKASNEVINIEHKTEAEVKELAKKQGVQNDGSASGNPTPG